MRWCIEIIRRIGVAFTISAGLCVASIAHAQSTAFTYQGQLKNGLNLAEGTHDVRFKLFNAASGGSQIGSTQCADNVLVKDGVFTSLIDFGPQFLSTADHWLEIEVRKDTGLNCGNTTGYTVLSPRQAITPTPRAEAATTANSLSLPNGSSVLVNLTNSGLVGVGTNAPTSQLHLNGVQDAFKISGIQPFMTLVDTNAGNARVLLQNADGDYYTVSESFLNGTNTGGFTIVDSQGRFGVGTFNPVGPFDARSTGGSLVLTSGGNVGIGTLTPNAALDVRGNVRMGSTGQYLAAGGEENLRIVRGTISAGGGIVKGKGFQCTRTATGRYSIVFNSPFVDTPSVTATVEQPSGGDSWISTNVTATDFAVYNIDPFLDGRDTAFHFIAVGPR